MTLKTTTNQLKRYWPTLIVLYVPIILGLIFLHYKTSIPIEKLTKDWASLAKVPFYWGSLSNIGVLLWWATAVICIFTFFLIKKRANQKTAGFFLFAGIFTAILAIDDLFFFHDIIFPQKLGIAEELILFLYFAAAAIFTIRFNKIIRNESINIFLYLAFLFFALGLVVDIATHNIFTKHFTFDLHHLLEDGTKILGIISWLTYFTTTAFNQISAINARAITIVSKTASTQQETIVSAN